LVKQFFNLINKIFTRFGCNFLHIKCFNGQLTKYPNAQMIMRGFIGGGKKMQPTMAYIKSTSHWSSKNSAIYQNYDALANTNLLDFI
jgi:hypothetical protein